MNSVYIKAMGLYHDAGDKMQQHLQEGRRHQHEEVAVVLPADAIVEEGTVMVEFINDLLTV